MCPYKCQDQQGLTLFRLALRSDRPMRGTATGVRGFFGNQFPHEILLHQHIPGTTATLYQYPKVQYRIAGGEITAIGIADGAAALGRVYDQFDEIRLGPLTYPIVERQGEIVTEPFGVTEAPRRYRFATPWVPLSPKNYPAFIRARGRQEQTALLERILTGNLLSASKTLGYAAAGRIVPSLTNWNQTVVDIKGTQVTGIEGEFRVNFAIPDELGIGRSVSRGNGVVEGIS
jgi:hypothetical protein